MAWKPQAALWPIASWFPQSMTLRMSCKSAASRCRRKDTTPVSRSTTNQTPPAAPPSPHPLSVSRAEVKTTRPRLGKLRWVSPWVGRSCSPIGSTPCTARALPEVVLSPRRLVGPSHLQHAAAYGVNGRPCHSPPSFLTCQLDFLSRSEGFGPAHLFPSNGNLLGA